MSFGALLCAPAPPVHAAVVAPVVMSPAMEALTDGSGCSAEEREISLRGGCNR